LKKKRPESLEGNTYARLTGCGKVYVTLNRDIDGSPFEVFLHIGKAGGCASAQCESIGRLISYALRIGGSIEDIISELKGIRCQNTTDEVLSCASAVADVLELEKSST
jgi:ribonucleoside-diphosphate reductase alpha chain